MEIASGLMDEIGARLTGSHNVKKANEWTRDKLTEFGLANSHLEPWGPFGRGWANEYVNVRMTSPDTAALIAYAKAWTPGTNGAVRGKDSAARRRSRDQAISRRPLRTLYRQIAGGHLAIPDSRGTQ